MQPAVAPGPDPNTPRRKGITWVGVLLALGLVGAGTALSLFLFGRVATAAAGTDIDLGTGFAVSAAPLLLGGLGAVAVLVWQARRGRRAR